MRIALLVNPVTADREANIAVALDMIQEAARRGSGLVLLGEMAVTGMVNNDDPAHDLPLAEAIPGALTGRLSETASSLGVWIGTGVLERDGKRLYDTALLFSPEGNIRLKYRRIQPQWHGRKADPAVYGQGTDLPVVETGIGSVAFMICGDLWDNELIRQMREMRPAYVLHPFARCFADGSRDQTRWERDELPQYQRRVADIGVPLLATSYVCTVAFSDEADAFGGAMVIDRDGSLAAAYPLNQTGILHFETDDLL